MPRNLYRPAALLIALTLSAGAVAGYVIKAGLSEEEEKKIVEKTIGPEVTDNSCVTCHALEVEAWKQTRHFATFAVAHTTPEAKEILKNMGEKSMKRSAECRQCHYTSILKGDSIAVNWGVSCESCHGPGKDWNDVHNVVAGQKLEWGKGKDQPPAQKAERLEASRQKGMIHSDMLYDIALNCFGCHTVPNETLVNKGKHKAGSEFDLVVWSQGEVRHNFSSSAGAPSSPNNRAAKPEQLRRLYVIGAVANLETSLRNLAGVKEKGGAFHQAMVQRVNAARAKVADILGLVQIPEIASALEQVPAKVDESTAVAPQAADALAAAGRKFVAEQDGSKLAALDAKVPADRKGTPYKP